MSTEPMTARALRDVAEQADPDLQARCTCASLRADAWESVPDDRWPRGLMESIGSLRDPELLEPTFEEFHPNGTHYQSPDAPVSVRHFPFNRCEAFRCRTCATVYLKYTEFGGYYVDHRVRRVDPQRVVD